jgi:beta-alanine--pyruvate transaminase
VLVPPRGYLERLREIATRHGILLIFDEVITGFGRLGAATAAERFDVTPDIITVAKGLTNGSVPMGAAIAQSYIYEKMLSAAAPGIELFHGYTYSGHPLAAAAGLATLDTYAEEGLFARARELEGIWENALHALRGEPFIRDIRNLGLTAAIELDPGEVPGARGRQIFHTCFDEGLLIRVTGDIIALSPPLIISVAQIAEIIDRLRTIVRRLA